MKPAFDDAGRPVQTVPFEFPGDDVEDAAAASDQRRAALKRWEREIQRECSLRLVNALLKNCRSPLQAGRRLAVLGLILAAPDLKPKTQRALAKWLDCSEARV